MDSKKQVSHLELRSDANTPVQSRNKKLPRFDVNRQLLFYRFYKNKIQLPKYGLYIDEILNDKNKLDVYLKQVYVINGEKKEDRPLYHNNNESDGKYSTIASGGGFEAKTSSLSDISRLSMLSFEICDYLFPVLKKNQTNNPLGDYYFDTSSEMVKQLERDELDLLVSDTECADNFLRSLELILYKYGFVVYVPRIKYVYSTNIPVYLNPTSLPFDHRNADKAIILPTSDVYARLQLIYTDVDSHLKLLTKVLLCCLEFKFGGHLGKMLVDIFQKYFFLPNLEKGRLAKIKNIDFINTQRVVEKIMLYNMQWTDLVRTVPMYKKIWSQFKNLDKYLTKDYFKSTYVKVKNNKWKAAIHLFSVVYLSAALMRAYSIAEIGGSLDILPEFLKNYNQTVLDWGIMHFPSELVDEIQNTIQYYSSFSLDTLLEAKNYLRDEYYLLTHNRLDIKQVQKAKLITEKRSQKIVSDDSPIVSISNQLKTPIHLQITAGQNKQANMESAFVFPSEIQEIRSDALQAASESSIGSSNYLKMLEPIEGDVEVAKPLMLESRKITNQHERDKLSAKTYEKTSTQIARVPQINMYRGMHVEQPLVRMIGAWN